MAEEQRDFEFAAVDSADILAERQQGWERFTQFVTWSVALTALTLALLAFFLA